MNPSTRQAIRKADEIRRKLDIGMFEPVNIFDICQRLEIDVRFIEINMEGLYANKGSRPTILLSALRPMPRRCFTCAHELGHHIFGHGNRLDVLHNDQDAFSDDEEEYTVDTFAGCLLMPTAAIQSQFAKRKWEINRATPLQFYTLASAFGTGYSTIVTQCVIKELITRSFANVLMKTTPAAIFKELAIPADKSTYFKVIDQYAGIKVIDLEVSNFLVLPKSCESEGAHLEKSAITDEYNIFVAKMPGITRIFDSTTGLNAFIRIQREKYIGLAEYRHLEN